MSELPAAVQRVRPDAPLPVRRQPRPAAIARRRRMVSFTKLTLPVAALLLLACVALWPELSRDVAAGRLLLGRGIGLPEAGQLTDATYHGVDGRGRPYTMTASTAREVSDQRVNLTEPKGDITLEGNRWLMVQARNGVYMQHSGSLDLSGDVQLYRDDGTTMRTDAATVDLKAGAGSGADRVHVEGPFGTLDAQGFAITEQGALLRFTGPGHLVLNARNR